MNGYELCRALKADPTLRDIPVILVTALNDPKDIIRGIECGADNFIRKPYSEEYLLNRISQVLLNQRLRKDAGPGSGHRRLPGRAKALHQRQPPADARPADLDLRTGGAGQRRTAGARTPGDRTEHAPVAARGRTGSAQPRDRAQEPRAGRSEPHEVGLHRQHVARAAHAAQRHHRLYRHAADEASRPADGGPGPPAQHHPHQRAPPALADQRHPRRGQDRSGQGHAGAGAGAVPGAGRRDGRIAAPAGGAKGTGADGGRCRRSRS